MISEGRFDEITQYVIGQLMGLLNAKGLFGGDYQAEISKLSDFSTVAAAKGDGFGAKFFGGLQGEQNVGGISGSGEAPGDIAGTDEALNLAGEDLIETVIVGYGSNGGSVGGKGEGGKGRPFATETAQQFTGNVLSVGCGATVAEDQYLLSAAQAVGEHLGHALQELG